MNRCTTAVARPVDVEKRRFSKRARVGNLVNRLELPRLTLLLLLSICLLESGCHRAAYRQRADAEAYALVRQKSNNPLWAIPDYTIAVDPRSRMFSPFNPDRPPMTPDDPAAHQLMHRVDNKPGYPRWDANGQTPFVENPEWLEFLPLDENGVLTLNADESVRFARLHSRDFQEALEELYLSALDVSFERFVFDSQLFGGYSGFVTADGPDRATSGGQSRSELDIGLSSAGARPLVLQKMGITGSTLIVGLANRLVWQFSGPNTHSATTMFDFALVQPLLRRAGRDRIMERLTLSERTLLANVRQMERFRRGFYLEVMTGVDGPGGPSRAGGVFGGSGLTGFTGVGGGGFGRIAQGGGGTPSGAGQTGAGQAGGYMGLLQRQQSIRNQRTNVAQLRSSLVQFQEYERANRIDYLQVLQAEQALYNAHSALINSETQYRNELDGFKITLGLPPQLDIEIKDNMLDQFNLLDPAIEQPQNELSEIQREVGRTIIQILNQAKRNAEGVETIEWSAELAQRIQLVRTKLAEGEMIRQRLIGENVRRAENDISQLYQSLEQRIADLDRLKKEVEKAASQDDKLRDIATTLLEKDELVIRVAKIRTLLDEAKKGLARFKMSFERLDKKLELLSTRGKDLPADAVARGVRRWILQRDSVAKIAEGAAPRAAPAPFEDDADKDLDPLTKQLTDLSNGILELSLVQARARADRVTMVPVDLDSNVAVEIARDYRLDWMNRRAALVNTWRLIEFNADSLESTLDIIFEGDVSNTGDNPLRLRSSTGRLRAGIQFDAPITRLNERNTYRQALIEYQQAKRSYYVFRDQVARGLRNTLRGLELNQLNFELRRSAILVAIEQVELARLRLLEPPKPDQPADAQRLGATTARDLVSALADLLNAQNDFISVWVTYDVLRRSLDLDLGTMRLDGDGIWVDPGPVTPDHGYPNPGEYQACSPEAAIFPRSHPQAQPVPVPEEIDAPPPTTSSTMRRLPPIDG